AKRMLKKKVIVKKLSSIFNFGEINVLCTDKTGTITEGSVKVKEFVNADGNDNEDLKLWASLNACLQSGFANPIDDAIKKLNTDISGYSKLGEVPYDFTRKRLSVLVKKNTISTIITKGAFANILAVCDQFETNGSDSKIDDAKKADLEKRFKDYSEGGLRVLAICKKDVNTTTIRKEDETEMIFTGFILLEDPLKDNVQQSIEKLKQLNVEIKIITGDNHYIAAYAARELGMDDSKIITGGMLTQISAEALPLKVVDASVFAEIEPSQKEIIIKALQKAGKAVAYMGDGINDVAAIHAADTGISVEDAVDVAKESADFVLLEKDLDVLTAGIYEGRKSFVNSMKYILINTGATFGNMFSLAGASLLLPFLPMLPKQILLTNFLTDFPYLAITSDNIDQEQMERPAKWSFKTIRSFMIVFGIHSSIFDFITFFVIYFYFKSNEAGFQTSWFIESVMTELVILFIIRTRKSFIKSKPGNLLIIISVIAMIVTILITLPPIAPLLSFSFPHSKQLIAIAIILSFYVITGDLLKIYFFKKFKN
ncbi:MAG: HAD-IC family P-type ATPase, partial [Chitinophagales bacterium]